MFGSKINPSGAAADLGDEIANSLRLNDDDSAYLSRTPSSPPANSRKTWTLSMWIKRSELAAYNPLFFGGTSSNYCMAYFGSGDKLEFLSELSGGATIKKLVTSHVYRDTTSWYHLVFVLDTANSTESDRMILYVNGVRQTDFDTETYRAQDDECGWNDVQAHTIGKDNSTGVFDGYIAKVEHFANQALAPTSFGRFSTSHGNVWVPIQTTASFGTNDVDFQLLFGTAPGTGAGAGDDTSGNANDWTESGLAADDQTSDTPTNNHCVMSSIDKDPSTATTLSDGNLKVSMSTTAGDGVRGTMALRGKKYWEVELDTVTTNSGSAIGVATSDHDLALDAKSASNRNAFLGANSFDSNLYGFFSGGAVDSAYGGLGNNFAAAGNYMMFALDTTAGKFWAGYNGTWFNSGDPAAGTGDSGKDMTLYDNWLPAISRIGSASSEDFIFNFGQHTFNHTVPTGFTAPNQENDQNLVTDLGGVDKPYEHFNTVLYTGDGVAIGSGGQPITGVGFQPDFTWLKNRDTTDNHNLIDAVRGVTNYVRSDATSAEASASEGLASFDTDGFTVGNNVQYNTNTENYVAWNWLANGSGVSNSDGSITSTVSASSTGAWSFGTYTGTGANATIGHGLGGAPDAYFVKNRDSAYSWAVYHAGVAADAETDYLTLNTTAAAVDDTAVWNDTAPTSSVFTVSTGLAVNQSGSGMYFIAFRSVPGICKVGKYTGNGSADGTMINCGFKPSLIITKPSSTTGAWAIFDAARTPTNDSTTERLFPDAADAEDASEQLDFLATGFKKRTSGGHNGSGVTYVYIAFAEQSVGGGIPFPNAR